MTYDHDDRHHSRERHVEDLQKQVTQLSEALARSIEDKESLLTATDGILRSAQRSSHMSQILLRTTHRLQREYATLVLTVYTQPSQLVAWAQHADADVVQMVRANLEYPRGKCQNCGVLGPLFSDTLECSWGCMPTAEGDRKLVEELNRQAMEDDAIAQALSDKLSSEDGKDLPSNLFELVSKSFEEDR